MMKFFCYTTVFTAIELFALARTERERAAMRGAMGAMKLLGLNAKSAGRIGDLVAKHSGGASLALLSAGLCVESGLPLLTNEAANFRGVRRLRIISGSSLREIAKRQRD